MHACVSEHVVQVEPFAPHAEEAVPGLQIPSLPQQPRHDAASHFGGAVPQETRDNARAISVRMMRMWRL